MKYLCLVYGMSTDIFMDIDKAYNQFDKIRLVFDLYLRQKTAREIWAKTLWSELNPQLLLEGMDDFIKQFKQLPKECRSLSIASVLKDDMRIFKNAIPLFIELKNDAMKETHWLKLMEQTGN